MQSGYLDTLSRRSSPVSAYKLYNFWNIVCCALMRVFCVKDQPDVQVLVRRRSFKLYEIVMMP